MLHRISVSLCFWCALGLLAGCGDSGPRRVAVEGTVTLDGKPLAHKGLMFIPQPGTPGNGAADTTDKDGKYSLVAVVFGSTRDMPGIPPGRYRVIVYEPLIPIADESGAAAEDGGPAPAVAPNFGRISQVPAIYSSPDTTPLVLDVPESGGALDVELASKPVEKVTVKTGK